MTPRRWIVLIVIDLVLLAGGLALTVPDGNYTAAALLIVAFVVGPVVLIMTSRGIERANRKRVRALEATHPGWSFVPCVTGPTQEALLKAAGERTTTGVAAVLAYGPGGIEIWAGKKSETKVFASPWSKVTGVSAASDIRTWQKRTVTGLRVTLAKGGSQEVAVLLKAPQVPALVEQIEAARTV
ncbi:hypothetical protein [Cellulomonas sp. URHD0024]|uniref:hypothetical protein n=1 Tax=Cellulomonas sp. URHD0024 TaxID=1302620 RepID=UPI0004161673|nr:hypothetical protein [Cellulomonas sp. URHD0024]